MYEVVVAVITIVGAVVVGRISGQWGSIRRVERLSELAEKVSDPHARRELQSVVATEVEREVARQRKRSTPGVVFIALYALMISTLTSGVVIGRVDRDIVTIFADQLTSLRSAYNLTRSQAIVVTVLARTQGALIGICVAYYIVWAYGSLAKRLAERYARQPPAAPTKWPRSIVIAGIVLQIVLLVVALFPGIAVLVVAVRSWVATGF